MGKPAQAARSCETAVHLEGDPQGGRECLALARLRQGDALGALAALRPILHPRMPRERFLLAAAVLERLGRKDEAVAQLRRALKAHGDDAETHAQLARLLRDVDPTAAHAHRTRALELARKSGNAALVGRVEKLVQ